MSTIAETIRRLRDEKGWTQKQLARAAKVSQPTIADLESGKQHTSRKLPAIAKALGVTVGYIDNQFVSEWDGDVSPSALNVEEGLDGPFAVKSVKVVGVAQAGIWTEFESFEDESFAGEEIPCIPGRYGHLPQTAYRVKGTSMDADRIFDGDYVVSVPYFDARSDITAGDRVVVERKRNSAIERTVKVVEIHGKEVHFCPRSSDPRFKPIVVKINRHMKEADDTDVTLVGLVIWRGAFF